ncbi:MAG: FHA domain-containing protein, partial [Gammaproteobacteria bacterium]|nr:FHA domain-containing protein [Gammaproteobacteria bacterium]
MKFNAVILIDSEGERCLDVNELPLRLGTGTDCEIRLPGPGSSAVALLDELDGEPFVQPVGNTAALKINGDVLSTSRKLAAGDELEFYGTRVVVGEADGAMRLSVQLEGSAYVTKPPELTDAAASLAEETIVATAFQRAVETAATEIKPS